MTEKIYYSLDEASTLTGIPANTLRTQLNRGQLSGVKITKGKRTVWAITPQVLQSLTSEQKGDDYEGLLAVYLSEMRSGVYSGRPLTAKHVKDMEKCLERYWKVLGEKPTAAGISASNFKTVMASFEADFKKKQDFYSTKMHIYKAVTGFMKILIREGYKTALDRQAITEFLPRKTFKLKKGFLELDEVQEAIRLNREWTHGRREYDIHALDILIALYAFAGLRKMEAANLSLKQVHLDEGGRSYLHVYGKWSKERLVPILPILREHIDHWMTKRRTESEWFIPTYDGIQLTESAINDRFMRFKEKYPKMAKISPHALRRSCATISAYQGMPANLIQRMLGHEDLKTTQGYMMLDEKHLFDWVQNSFFNMGTGTPVTPKQPEPETEKTPAPQPVLSPSAQANPDFLIFNDGF